MKISKILPQKGKKLTRTNENQSSVHRFHFTNWTENDSSSSQVVVAKNAWEILTNKMKMKTKCRPSEYNKFNIGEKVKVKKIIFGKIKIHQTTFKQVNLLLKLDLTSNEMAELKIWTHTQKNNISTRHILIQHTWNRLVYLYQSNEYQQKKMYLDIRRI